MTANTASQTAGATRASAKTKRIAASILAICMGLGIIGFIGFSHIDVVHNAAHDTRHSFAFPCH